MQLSRFLRTTSDLWFLMVNFHRFTLHISSLHLCFLVGKIWMSLALEEGCKELMKEAGPHQG